MTVKILICAVTLLALVTAGCGEEKIIGKPDEAVIAYAENAMPQRLIGSLKAIIPLSDASTEHLTQAYRTKLKDNLKFKTTLKNEGSSPVVELTATPLDQGAAAKSALNNDNFIALLGMIGQLKADGATEEQLKDNRDVQELAIIALEKYINELSFQPEQTIAVPCVKVTGEDGNAHWAPAEGAILIDFLTGHK